MKYKIPRNKKNNPEINVWHQMKKSWWCYVAMKYGSYLPYLNNHKVHVINSYLTVAKFKKQTSNMTCLNNFNLGFTSTHYYVFTFIQFMFICTLSGGLIQEIQTKSV